MLPHKAGVRLRMVRGESHVFIQVEGRDAGKIELAARMHGRQFSVKPQRRAPRCQPQHGPRPGADQRGRDPGRFSRSFPGGGCDDNFHPANLGKRRTQGKGIHTRQSGSATVNPSGHLHARVQYPAPSPIPGQSSQSARSPLARAGNPASAMPKPSQRAQQQPIARQAPPLCPPARRPRGEGIPEARYSRWTLLSEHTHRLGRVKRRKPRRRTGNQPSRQGWPDESVSCIRA